ncbi:MAG: histidinol-phosphate transaminase [Gammaproteobacteria bacterium]|nr:histidinol-phosphate transaminase [Gammaproteobacteria bacterium]
MRFSFMELATSGVRNLQPYVPGKPVAELEREYGVRDAIKLASNENPLGPSPRVLGAIQQSLTQLARYPDGAGFELRAALARRHGVQLDQITLGNGSNDLLELVTRAFVTPQHEVVFSEHAFAVYPIVTQAVGATARVAAVHNWGHDLDAMGALVNERTRVVFIANPNNPTGTWLSESALEDFLQTIPPAVLVVVDEAYFEYARDTAADYPDASQWLTRFPNLIVTRTFSKAYGLAGLRVGYALSQPEVADMLNRVRQPFNVNNLGQVAALAALEDTDHLARSLACNREGMAQVTSAFALMGLTFIPSAGNFVCVDTGRDALDVYDALLREGVIVRPVANYGMPQHLRVTIGLPEENERFIKALEKVLAKNQPTT